MTNPTAMKRKRTTIEPTVPGFTIDGSGVAAIGNNLPMGKPQGRIKTITLWALFILFTGVMSVAGFRFANPAIRADLVAFTIDSNTQTTIRFQIVRRNPMLPITCRVIARDFSTAIVGDRYVEVEASKLKSIELKEVIPTRSKAVTAAVVRCLPKDR
jgi:hypothetical protein